MNLQHLKTFCTVISEGSMTAAADKLYLTQPAISQQIRNLEESIGVELLVRGVRQVKTTVQGQLLYDYAKRIIHLTQQAEIAIQTMSTEVRGHLRIGTTNSLGLYLLSPVLGMFLRHNSKLSVNLSYARGDDIIRAMKKGDMDVAILPDIEREFSVVGEGIGEEFLFKDEMWLVGSGRDGTLPNLISIRQLTDRPFVSYRNKYPGFDKFLNAELDKVGVEMKPVCEVANAGTVKKVIESGLGWGFLPAHSIHKQVRFGRMSRVEVEEVKYSVNTNYYYAKDDRNAAAKDVLLRALQQGRTS